MKEKRYAVTINAYIYADDDEQAKIKADELTNLLREIEDNHARLVSLKEAPFASLGDYKNII